MSDALEDNSIHPDQKHILLMDFSNAFSSISCDLLIQEVLSHISSLYPWMGCSYGSQPFLLLGDKSISSCCGVQQGDPLGSLGFSLVLHPMVQKIIEQVPHLIINTWYVDDGTLCGSPDDLARTLAIIKSDSPSRGLYLNKAKSLHFITPGSSAFHCHLHGIPSTSNGFTLLGSPIGPIKFCEASALDRI